MRKSRWHFHGGWFLGLLVLTLRCAFTLQAAPATQTTPPAQQPNFVLLLSDDGGWADWGCYGSKDFKTPQLDRLAASGVRFTQAYVCASICGPSRAGLITGRYPHRFGFEYNNVPGAMHPNSKFEGREMGLPLDQVTIAQALRGRGYRSMIAGKWHLGIAERFRPLERGFDRFYGFLGGARSYFPIKKVDEDRQLWNDRDPAPEPRHTTDDFTTAALDFMRAERGRPFFLFLSYNAVHSPLNALSEDEAPYAHLKDPRRRKLGGMTAGLDRNIGRVLDEIERLGLAERTVVLFLNDNGGECNQIGADNGPLAGMKGTCYEGGVRVPFVLRWPGVTQAGRVSDLPVSSLDIFASFFAAAGGDIASLLLEGVDLRPFLDGRAPAGARPHDTLYWRKGPHAAIRHLDWKLHRHPDRPIELYDLAADIGEKKDLSAARPDVVRDLLARLWAWEKQNSRHLWMEQLKYDIDTIERIDTYHRPVR